MNTCAGEPMHRDLTAVMEEDLIQDAVHILYSHNLSGIPVVKKIGSLWAIFRRLIYCRQLFHIFGNTCSEFFLNNGRFILLTVSKI